MYEKTGFTELILNCLKLEFNAYLNDPGLGEAVYTYLVFNHFSMKYRLRPKTPAEYIQIVSHHGKLPQEVIAFTIENYKEPMIDLHKDLNDTEKILKLFEKHASHFLQRLTFGENALRIPVKERDKHYTDYRSNNNPREWAPLDTYNAYIFKSDLRLLRENANVYFLMAHYRPGLFRKDWIITAKRPTKSQKPKPTKTKLPKTKPRLRVIEGSKK